MATTASFPPYMLPGVAVHQPPHLEGDASLATEILPGPPSSASAQQSLFRRDPKKPSIAYSYLPPSDPGSTYSGIMHGTLIGQDLEGARSKRARGDKGVSTGRAQRASARKQGNSVTALDPSLHIGLGLNPFPQPIHMDSESSVLLVDKEPSISRSNSSVNLQELPSAPSNSNRVKRKDKGKGKETGTPPLRIKEEPKLFSLQSPEPPSNLLNNEDHCSSCRSYGSLVYCDGCPRAFHFWCLDPPLESVDDDGDARWFCSTCMARKHPPHKPAPSLLSSLIHQLQTSNPVEFQLPDEIRTFFKDVTAGPKGNYVVSSEIKPPRLNRHGQLEERDPYRLRDRNNGPVLCFQCGLSALPTNLTASPVAKRPRTSPASATSKDAWKAIISCDYCNLHWHLDCLEPPLLTLPLFNKKWMCPNHVEHTMPSKHRVPKQHLAPIEISKPLQYNNGNIEVIHSEFPLSMPKPSVTVDEVLINGRRYRVPERVIVLDFWNKLNKWDEHMTKDPDFASGMSSPLTSISSLDDLDDHALPPVGPLIDDFSAAQLLCGLSTSRKPFQLSRKLTDRGIQTEYELPKPPTIRNKVGRPRKHPIPAEPATSRVVRNLLNQSGEPTNTSPTVTISTTRRRLVSQQVMSEVSSRELRSRSRNLNHVNDTPLPSISSRSSLRQGEDLDKDASGGGSMLTLNNPSVANIINVKLEEIDGYSLLNDPMPEPTQLPKTIGISRTPRVIRTPRQTKQKETGSPKETKERRGRKRKVRDDELPVVGGENGFETYEIRDTAKNSKEKVDRGDKAVKETIKSMKTPIRYGQLQKSQDNTPTSSSVSINSPLSKTPSLKIRLPRLSNFNVGTNVSSSHLDTPTRR